MKRKIGEIFDYNGEWYQCVKGERCKNCDLEGLDECYSNECRSDKRKDDEEVIYKKLEKVGEPLEFAKGLYFQKYRLVNHTAFYEGDTRLFFNVPTFTFVYIEIKQNQENMEDNKKQTSLNSTKSIYEKFKGKTMQCLVNNKDGDLVNGYGIVCGYNDKYLIIGFTNGYEGCIKSFTDNVFLENRDFLSYRFWNISHVDDKPFIKPFNLESARSGKPVCTRDGRKARILCYDLKGAEYPIVAAVETRDRFAEIIFGYDKNGRFDRDIENNYDLMMLQEKKSGWINVYKRLVYRTKEEAQSNINPDNEVIDTIKISWEE